MITTINERDLNVLAAQRLRRVKSTESATDDYNPRTVNHLHEELIATAQRTGYTLRLGKAVPAQKPPATATENWIPAFARKTSFVANTIWARFAINPTLRVFSGFLQKELLPRRAR